MHYLIALMLWLGFIAWIVRASSIEPDGRPGRFRWVGRLAAGGSAAACAALVAIATGAVPQFRDDPASIPSSYGIPAAARPMPAYASYASVVTPPVGPAIARPVAPTAAPLAVAPLAGTVSRPPAAVAARVRVMPGTGLRAQPSRNASVLRVAHQGGVLRRFGAANGWIQVGMARPEGWVLESAAVPAG